MTSPFEWFGFENPSSMSFRMLAWAVGELRSLNLFW